jgi:hypothetical protein
MVANATRRHSASILDFASRHGTPGTGISEHTQYGEYVEDRDAEPIEPTGVAIFQDLEVGFATGRPIVDHWRYRKFEAVIGNNPW